MEYALGVLIAVVFHQAVTRLVHLPFGNAGGVEMLAALGKEGLDGFGVPFFQDCFEQHLPRCVLPLIAQPLPGGAFFSEEAFGNYRADPQAQVGVGEINKGFAASVAVVCKE